MKRCLHCGIAEVRGAGKSNIEPVSGLCLDCLIVYAKETPKDRPLPMKDFDPRQRQTGEAE
jgi:hypothetical protein